MIVNLLIFISMFAGWFAFFKILNIGAPDHIIITMSTFTIYIFFKIKDKRKLSLVDIIGICIGFRYTKNRRVTCHEIPSVY